MAKTNGKIRKESEPQNHCYEDSSELNDLVKRMKNIRSHQVIEIHQIFSWIVKIETSDDTRHLLHAQITKKKSFDFNSK